ncbi:hypothetical protein KCU92_g80, partial [Aureobasidium melanogenum]
MVCVSRLRKFRIAFAVVVDLASSDSCVLGGSTGFKELGGKYALALDSSPPTSSPVRRELCVSTVCCMGGVVYKLIWQEEKKDGSTLGIVGQGLGSNVEKLSKGMSMMCFQYVRAAVLCYARGRRVVVVDESDDRLRKLRRLLGYCSSNGSGASIRTVAQTHVGSTPLTAINSSVRLSAKTIKVHIAQSITHQRKRIIVLPVLDRRPRQASRNPIDGVAPRTRRMTETIIDSGLERPLQDFHGEFARDVSAGSNPTESASAALFEGGGLGQVNAIAGLACSAVMVPAMVAFKNVTLLLDGSQSLWHPDRRPWKSRSRSRYRRRNCLGHCRKGGKWPWRNSRALQKLGIGDQAWSSQEGENRSWMPWCAGRQLFDEFAGRRTINAYLYSSPGLVQVAQPDLPLVSEIIAKAHLWSGRWDSVSLLSLVRSVGVRHAF